MEIQKKASPNYRKGRDKRLPIAIVDHITAGLMPGTLSWLCNPEAKASSHYLVTKQGIIYQLVADEDTAWHAGVVQKPNWSLYNGRNPNVYTLGIEHECISGGELTEMQYQATLWLHQLLCSKWNIKIDQDHIIGHYRINSVNRPNDPGPNFPWARLFADLKGEVSDGNLPAGAKASSIEIGGKRYPTYVLNNVMYFQEGVQVRPIVEDANRKIQWLANEFRAILNNAIWK